MRKSPVLAAVAMLSCSLAGPRSKAAGPPERVAPNSALTPVGGALLTIPAETEASIVLLSGLHTKIAQVQDRVEGELTRPVYVDGQMVLPEGTLLFGRITKIKGAGRMHRPAEVGFRFDEISLPDGESETVAARLASLDEPGQMRVDREGYLRGAKPFSWRLITGGLLGAGGLAVVPKLVGATAAASVGTAATAGAVGFFALFPRGPEVHLPPDTHCRVRFDDSFTVHGQS